ncbi:MAG: triple tyrosine motif-containing protein [Sphingomonas sp.]
MKLSRLAQSRSGGIFKQCLRYAATAAIIVTFPAQPAMAQSPAQGFNALKHVRWGPDEGAPTEPHRIVQTPDGYIWTSGANLHRFDGISFERIDWPADAPWKRVEANVMVVRRNGELWLGLNSKPAVAVYRGGRLIPAGMPRPPGPITAMAESPDGTMWFASRRLNSRLLRLRRGRWESLGLPPGQVLDMIASRDGSLWMTLGHGGGPGTVAVLPPGALQFQVLPDRAGRIPTLAVDPNGAVWMSSSAGTRMLADATGKRQSHALVVPISAAIRNADISFDRDGGLWRTSRANGISYVPRALGARSPGDLQVHPFTALHGLSSDVTFNTLVDREGSVWISTDAGLDQFRAASATQEQAIPSAPTDGLAIAKATDGSVYILSGDKLFYIAPRAAPRLLTSLGNAAVAICPARGGGIWLVQPANAARIQATDVHRFQSYGGADLPVSCAEDRAGRLWVSLDAEKLIWRDDGGWHRSGGAIGKQRPWEISATRSGKIAFGSGTRLATLDGDRLTLREKYGTATMITTSGDDVFVSDDGGLVRLRGDEIKRLDDKRFPWLIWLRAMVQTEGGETWLVAAGGIYRVATADLDRAFQDRRAPLPYRLFDRQDGLLSAAQHPGFKGTQIVEGGDGRIWFLNRQGAGYFEPAKLKPNPLAPPIAIRSLTSGGNRWRDPASLVLPAGTRALDIGYAGLSFIVPQRLHFRYQLEGVDTDWVDAGARRLASYTNLEPGRYRFRVIAANADGIWNRTGATLDFEIRPTFWQSTPFKLLCAFGLLGLIWACYVLRLRTVAARIRLRMTERFEERERIARELHDTLLQGIQSVTLRFQRVVDELPAQQPARGSLLQALDVADQVIAEGRDRVQDLRSRQHDALEPLLRELVAQQLFEPGVEIGLSESGRRRRLEPLALDEIARLAGEALTNIRRHAGAARVEIGIRYGGSLRLQIADDGVGIDPAVAGAGKPGHFGVRGMRERACKLQATLVIRPIPDHGTELVLTVPGRVAYLPERRSWWARIRRVG